MGINDHEGWAVGVVERWGTEVQLRNKIKSLIANDFVALIASYRSICRSSADLKEDICLCIFTNIAVSVEVLSYGDFLLRAFVCFTCQTEWLPHK